MNPSVPNRPCFLASKSESIIHILSHRRYMNTVEELKREAGKTACSFVRDGMKIGLGTGSTIKYTVIEIGRMI